MQRILAAAGREIVVVIVGPGAIGCLFAALLAEKGLAVALLDKNPERSLLLSREGIRVKDSAGERLVHVPCEADPFRLSPPAFLCLCIKSFDTEAAMRHALPLLGAQTVIVSLQNGLGNAEIAARLSAGRPILCAATSHGSTAECAGVVRHAGAGPTIIAPHTAAADYHARAFADMLMNAGIESHVTPDAATLLWSKAAINAAINPVTAIADVPNGAILEREDLRMQAEEAALETERVARAMGINLIYDNTLEAVQNVCRNTASNFSSMLQDIRRGRRTEIEAINGEVVRHGRRLGIPVPVNEELLHRVLEISADRR